jgi:hypothetical protein
MTTAECAICFAGEIETREPIEVMTAIPYDENRDGLGRETETIYACAECSSQEGFAEDLHDHDEDWRQALAEETTDRKQRGNGLDDVA